MFQPEAKHQFVRRYCNPRSGWLVHVDIDPSEEGRTGGDRKTEVAKRRQQEMLAEATAARQAMEELGVIVGGLRQQWFDALRTLLPGEQLPSVPGDRDIIAAHVNRRLLLVAEVEGVSSGQPETKLYKAIGQAVVASTSVEAEGFTQAIVIAVVGEKITAHLRRVSALTKLGISGVSIAEDAEKDEWCFVSDSLHNVLD